MGNSAGSIRGLGIFVEFSLAPPPTPPRSSSAARRGTARRLRSAHPPRIYERLARARRRRRVLRHSETRSRVTQRDWRELGVRRGGAGSCGRERVEIDRAALAVAVAVRESQSRAAGCSRTIDEQVPRHQRSRSRSLDVAIARGLNGVCVSRLPWWLYLLSRLPNRTTIILFMS